MNDEPSAELAIFLAVVKLPAEEQPAYLTRECGGDDSLRARVEGLLRANGEAGHFMEEFPGTRPAKTDEIIGEKAGDHIGRYKLLEQIGEGGCGVVFMAEQEEPVRRRVALKVIKPGMDTKSVIARFEAERQALALMDHPNIAKIFDAGATESGRPFFVMELISGIKITEYCDQNSLSTTERLILFIKVCQSVQHAHQKGIIHRDIKPSNVLVTTTNQGAAEPMIIDFGIAKATMGRPLTQKTLITALGMLVGTPAYMSPEQAALGTVDVDTRSDVYSLGILLYELLTGAPPLDAGELLNKGFDEIRRVICEEEAPRPSTRLGKMTARELTTVALRRGAEAPTLIRTVRGDLDWIVMKALEKDRKRRFETVNGLALDVQRFLAQETVSARPPSTWYRLRKATQRNRLVFAGVGSISFLVVASLVVVSTLLAQERRAFRLADGQKARAQESTRFLEEMLRGVGPSVARGKDTAMLRGILDSTAKRLGAELTNQPEVEAHLSGLVSELYLAIGSYRQAEEMGQIALGLDRALYGTNSVAAATALNNLGLTYWRENKNEAAEKADLESLKIRRNWFGEDGTNVATTLNNLADVYRHEHIIDKAELAARKALGLRKEAFGTNSLEAAESMRALCILAGDEHDYSGAEALAREVLGIRQAKLEGDDPQIAESLNDLAWVLGFDDRWAEVEQLRRKALALQGNILDHTHPKYLETLANLCGALERQGKWIEAVEWRQKALELWKRRAEGNSEEASSQIARLTNELAYDETQAKSDGLGPPQENKDDWSSIENLRRQTLENRRKLSGNDSPDTISDVIELAHVLRSQGKLLAAERELNEALTPGLLNKPESSKLLYQRADLRGHQGRWKEAADDAMMCIEREPTEHVYYYILAPLLAMDDNFSAYEQLCRRFQTAFTNVNNPYWAERIAVACLLRPTPVVDLHATERMADDAVTQGKGEAGRLPFFQICKAMSSYRLGHYSDAITWAEKSRNSSLPYASSQAYAVLAMANWQTGRAAEARAMLAKAESLAPDILFQRGVDKFEGGWWVDYPIARVEIKEAEALIQPRFTEGPRGKP